MNQLAIVPGVLVLAVMFGGAWRQRQREIRLWNGGICAATNKPWIYFDTTSQGCRGYKSDGNYMWATYAIDIK